MSEPPNLPGIPGMMTRAAHTVRKATQIFPPLGFGIGAGIGVGCGVGWPLRRAYGPPAALCGPAIGIGIGFGYGQGFGRRFGKDQRSHSYKEWVNDVEVLLDSFVLKLLAIFRLGSQRKILLPATSN